METISFIPLHAPDAQTASYDIVPRSKRKDETMDSTNTTSLPWRKVIPQAILISLWVFVLRYSDSYFMPYLVIAALSVCCLFLRKKSRSRSFPNRRGKRIAALSTALFTFMATASNYRLWKNSPFTSENSEGMTQPVSIAILLVLIAGGCSVFGNLFYTLAETGDRKAWTERKHGPAWHLFLICFVAVSGIDLLFLFGSKYPGCLTYDSVNQMQQILSGEYVNKNPFYQTQLIRFWVTLGTNLWGDINAGVALFHIFQILTMAACFSSAVMTLSEIKAPGWIIIGSILFYVLMPYHIEYSYTMWKDVLFGGFCLLFCVYLYRIIAKVGHRGLNYVILTLAGFCFCLVRNNGLIAFVLMFFLLLALWRGRQKGVLVSMASIIVVTFVMKHAVINALQIQQLDLIETVSLPAQQVARVVTYENDLSEKEYTLLSKVVDVEAIPETYWEIHSDPIKDLVRAGNNQEELRKNGWEYINLYLTLGFRHPGMYMEAWIEQTRGYWNSGYLYWIWSDDVLPNDIGIVHTIRNEGIDRFLNSYLRAFETNGILHLLVSIGLMAWLHISAFIFSALRRDREGLTSTLPALIIWFTLLLGVPVFSEFRYMYPAFCVFPFCAAVVTRPLSVRGTPACSRKR